MPLCTTRRSGRLLEACTSAGKFEFFARSSVLQYAPIFVLDSRTLLEAIPNSELRTSKVVANVLLNKVATLNDLLK